MNKKGIKKRANGNGSAIRVGANNYKAVIVVGYKDGDFSKPIRKVKRGFATKAEALEYCHEFITGGFVPRKTKTIEMYYEDCCKSIFKAISASQLNKMKLAHSRIEPIKNIDVRELGLRELQNVVDLQETYYQKREIKILLSHIFKRACAENYINNNLAQYIVLPELVEHEQEAFNLDEIQTFWSKWHEGEFFFGYILLMIYTGMMPAELLACKKSMIKIEDHIIVGCGKKTTKRKEAPIVLADEIIPVVEMLMFMAKGENLVDYKKSQFYKNYEKHIKALEGVRYLPMYSCRHTTASLLAEVESSPEKIKEHMRHSQIQTTQRYIHLDTAEKQSTANKISTKSH